MENNADEGIKSLVSNSRLNQTRFSVFSNLTITKFQKANITSLHKFDDDLCIISTPDPWYLLAQLSDPSE